MPTKMYYWRNNKGGPTQGALIFQNDTLEFDINDPDTFEQARLRIADALGEAWKAPIGGWTVESMSPRGVPILRTKSHPTLADAVREFRQKVSEQNAYDAKLKHDPAFALEEALKSHDWYSAYSDDHRVWAAGEAASKRLKELCGKVPVEKVRELWKKYAPADSTCPV